MKLSGHEPEVETTLPSSYDKEGDIWSMGCVFSEMLVRSSLGQEGVERYREARAAQHRDEFNRPAGPQAFHALGGRLQCVEQFHAEVLARHPDDDVLRAVSEVVLDFMLQPLEERAKDALAIRQDWISRVGGESIAPGKTTPAAPSPPSPAPSPSAALPRQ